MERCRAKSKRSREQCKNYAIKGWGVCRMHGAGGGPRTWEGYIACKKGPSKHGFYSKEAREELRDLQNSISQSNARINKDFNTDSTLK